MGVNVHVEINDGIIIYLRVHLKSVKLIYRTLYENHAKTEFLIVQKSQVRKNITWIFRNKAYKLFLRINKKINSIEKRRYFIFVFYSSIFLGQISILINVFAFVIKIHIFVFIVFLKLIFLHFSLTC